jgi:SAM-dependent methyltransferase
MAKSLKQEPLSGTLSIKTAIKDGVRSLIPLAVRKQLSILINKQKWIDGDRRSWWSLELIRDFEAMNINEYHKFLWSHHLSYAAPYEVARTFGRENMKQSRVIFFSDLRKRLIELSSDPAKDIESVFEVGCSLGYQLRYLETDLFSSAAILEGVDIDAYAVDAGNEYLMRSGSKVRLQCADMEGLDRFLGNKCYDIIICTGVLMYLKEEEAVRVVDIMLRHTNVLLGFSGLAHPDIDNSGLHHSVSRESDHSFIHNIDSMVRKAGGRVVARRWEGGRLVDGHTIYFVFAIKSASA